MKKAMYTKARYSVRLLIKFSSNNTKKTIAKMLKMTLNKINLFVVIIPPYIV